MAAENGKTGKFEISDPQRKGIHGECNLKSGDHLSGKLWLVGIVGRWKE